MRWLLLRLCSIRVLCVIVGCFTLIGILKSYSEKNRYERLSSDVHESEPPKSVPQTPSSSKARAPAVQQQDEKIRQPAVPPKERGEAFRKEEPVPPRLPFENGANGEKKRHEVEGERMPEGERNIEHHGEKPVASNKVLFYDNVIIHFDLKGAAPKADYLKKVIKLVKENGATGILLEWEDTFPWTGVLERCRADDFYSLEEVKDILNTSKGLGLDVIPLVQTFGHLEWILKHESFRKHRENDMYPQVVCLADDEGVALVKEAISQVIAVHKQFGLKFFHMGADEAFEYGVCAKDLQWIMSRPGRTKGHLATEHFKKIANYITSLHPGTKVLAWHDMLKTLPQSLSREVLGSLIEPVVWDYSETIQQQNEFTWRELASSFPVVWGSSSYKGANNPSAQELDIQHYMQNNRGWIRHKSAYAKYFQTFRGLILTGWQRYDHFAGLCEILPVGLPSAVVNLQIANAGMHPNQSVILAKVSASLGCPATITLQRASEFSRCNFPGVEVFKIIHVDIPSLKSQVQRSVEDEHWVKGWLGRFNRRHNYTQLWYLRSLQDTINFHYSLAKSLEMKLRLAMKPIFYENTIDEWIYSYLDPTTEVLKKYLDDIGRLMQLRVFPKRNIKILREP